MTRGSDADERDDLRRKMSALKTRSDTLHAIREFFRARDFIEVETPVRLPTPALELHIDAEPSGAWYLRTSPELHMKRLLAAGYERIVQVGPCFRQSECGRLHHPEYTMLEWYRAHADYNDILADTRALIGQVVQAVIGRSTLTWQGIEIDVGAEWRVVTVQDAFVEWAGWDPIAAYDADRFDLDLIEKVEPRLREIPVPVVFKDYPLAAAALSRPSKRDPRVAERWELYLCGVEIANAYSELTDAGEQEQRFRECAEQRRAAAKIAYPVDEAFLAALRNGLPPCGGIALGVDRLVMLLAGAESLRHVNAFQEYHQ